MWLHCSQLRERSQTSTLLQLHAEDLGLKPDDKHDDYDARLDVQQIHRSRQAACEQQLRAWVEEVLVVQDAETPQLAREAMRRGVPVLWRPSLEHRALRWRGTPTMVVRADVLDELVAGALLDDEHRVVAGPHCPAHRLACAREDRGDDTPWACPRRACRYTVEAATWHAQQWPRLTHYRIVQLHYGSLDVLKDGTSLGNGAAMNKCRTLAVALNAMLGDMQGFRPPTAYLMGRCYRSTAWDGVQDDCTSMLAHVFHHNAFQRELETRADAIRDMVQWPLDRVRQTLQEQPRDSAAWPWKRALATLQGAPPVAPPLVLPSSLPAATLDAVQEWSTAPPLEFVVDFETVSNLDDDFARFPRMGGAPMIFMIGCGRLRSGKWIDFQHFIVDRLTRDEERRIVQAWLDHVLPAQVAADDDQAPAAPSLLHWARAERDMYAAARARHPDAPWPAELPWRDACTTLYRHLREPLGLANTQLKATCHALRDVVATQWEEEGPCNGEAAMAGAWWCHHHADHFATHPLMVAIGHYNVVDCKTVSELVHFARTLINHRH